MSEEENRYANREIDAMHSRLEDKVENGFHDTQEWLKKLHKQVKTTNGRVSEQEKELIRTKTSVKTAGLIIATVLIPVVIALLNIYFS